MLVVLDTNVFHSDVHADRGVFRSVLDGAAKGMFELYVPEVVLQELDKQYARRSKKVVRDINKAIGEHDQELRKLGHQRPARMCVDDEDVVGYRPALEGRLERAGVQVLTLPADLSLAVEWSVNRRKPFKQTGEGFPDAVIWLSVLDLASARDEEIVLVTSNSKDFGDGQDPPALAAELSEDLTNRGSSRDRVRLVLGIDAFAKEVGERLHAYERAEELVSRNAFGAAIEDAVLYSSLDQRSLMLGVDLDNDPRVVGCDLESLTIEDARRLPDGQLFLEATGETTVVLELLIHKADYYLEAEADGSYFTVTDPNFNERYVEAESELVVELGLTITTDFEATDVQADITETRLAPVEIVQRALRGRGLSELLAVLRQEISGRSIDEYSPDERIESDLDEVTVASVYRDGTAHLKELIESDGERHLCIIEARLEADVEWAANAPTPFDAEHFASNALNESSGAPILCGHESAAPLVVDLTAAWDPEHGWHNVDVNGASLAEREAERRAGRGTAADDFLAEIEADRYEELDGK